MLTGEIRNQVDRIWDTFWSGGISNPLEVIEQIARSGATVGKVALIRPDDPPCIAGAYFITMRFDETIDPVYARAVLSAPSVRSIVARRSRQAAQQNFSGPGLRALPMPVPPLELQREYAKRVSAIDGPKATLRGSLEEFDALFASLQHRAFRGEL